MNKNILKIVGLTLVALTITSPVFAQTKTSTPTPTEKATITPRATAEAEVEKIKDLVASKVATLKLVEKKGLIGTVRTAGNTEISITDSAGNSAKVDIDELTKFQGATDKEDFGISDIEKGDVLSFVGLYNKETKKLLARFIERATNIPTNLEGLVTEKNAKNFTITIVGDDGKPVVLNIESSTKTSNFEDGDLVKSGFSKIEVGDRVVVSGFPDTKEKNQINAERIVRLVGIPGTAGMKKAAASVSTETSTPTEETDK